MWVQDLTYTPYAQTKGYDRQFLGVGESQWKIRIHPVHKREEARLVLTDWFEDKEQHGEERSLKGEARIQDL